MRSPTCSLLQTDTCGSANAIYVRQEPIYLETGSWMFVRVSKFIVVHEYYIIILYAAHTRHVHHEIHVNYGKTILIDDRLANSIENRRKMKYHSVRDIQSFGRCCWIVLLSRSTARLYLQLASHLSWHTLWHTYVRTAKIFRL